MKWLDGIKSAIDYIEDNICEDLSIGEIARQAYVSPYYFQKGFSMLCGFSVSDYIRNRRLSLAGSELVSTDIKIIDIALKYGYDSPDSFTKAFTRFHGVTPTAVRKDKAAIKSFARLKIIISLEGGYIMDYKIMEKDAFTIIGASKMFNYENATKEIPPFWAEHFQSGKNEIVCGVYGICFEKDMGTDKFEYLIADDYIPHKEIPAGFVTKVISKHTWAIFPCKGPLPGTLQDTSKKIFSEWLPNNKDYEIAAGLNIEFYSNPADYPNGTTDENYYSEIWIPVKKTTA